MFLEKPSVKFLITATALIGSFTLLKTTSKFLSRYYYCRKARMFQQYGCQGAYVLVTGALAPIGNAFCEKMASEGFNVFMIDKESAEESANVLKMDYPEVEVKWLVADFAEMNQLS